MAIDQGQAVILYYLDASGWGKRYFSEKGADWVQGLFPLDEPMVCATLGVTGQEDEQ
jgi:hypothetical protein